MKNLAVLLGMLGIASVLSGITIISIDGNFDVAITMMCYGLFMALISAIIDEKVTEINRNERLRKSLYK